MLTLARHESRWLQRKQSAKAKHAVWILFTLFNEVDQSKTSLVRFAEDVTTQGHSPGEERESDASNARCV